MSKPKKLYVLQYDMDNCPDSDSLMNIRDSIMSAIPDDEAMLILPNSLQIHKLAIEDLEYLYQYIGSILEDKKIEG